MYVSVSRVTGPWRAAFPENSHDRFKIFILTPGEPMPHLGTPSAGPDPCDDVLNDRDDIARDDYGRADLRSFY